MQLKVFKEIFALLEGIGSIAGHVRIVSIILAKIYPLLFSEHLLLSSNQDCPIEIYTKNFIKSPSFGTGTLDWEQLRLIQVIVLMKSVRVCEEDEGELEASSASLEDSNRFGITLIANDPSKRELFNQHLSEGHELFNQFLRIHRELKPAALTGWLNLLHPIVKTRPSLYPSLIPTLLSFTETKFMESFTLVQRRNILHTLKAELLLLTSIPKAEKFHSLISESYEKCEASQVAGNNKKKGGASAETPDEEDEKELVASLGGIQERMGQRPSGAFAESSNTSEFKKSSSLRTTATVAEYESLASEALSRELIKIPGPMATEMVVRMLGSWSIEQIQPVIISKWNRIREESPTSSASAVVSGPEIVLKKSTEEAFSLEAGPMTPELPGEIIHLGVSRILQSITDLSEFHVSSRRDDLIAKIEGDDEEDFVATVPSNANSGTVRGIPIPLIPLCRIIALVAAHVGHVRSDILMDPEDRRKKLDQQFDPRFQKKQEKEVEKSGKEKDIFGSSSDEEDVKMEVDEEDEDEFDKTVNQIVLGWINEDLPGRFDFVWFWLEAVWVREGKSGNLESSTSEEIVTDYDKLFDDIIGLVGEYFISDEEDEEKRSDNPSVLERVLKILLQVPKLNASFIRNLLYPLIEEVRYRPIALGCLARLLLQRPALRAMLADFVMTLAESEDASLRKDTIEILLLKSGVYPNLRSISSQLEAYSLDLMDDLTGKETTVSGESAMKKLKLESSESLFDQSESVESSAAAEIDDEAATEDNVDSIDISYYEANTELFLGLLKKNPEKLLPPLLVRFPRFSVKLQAFLLDRSLPHVVQSWTLKELRGLLKVLQSESKVDEGGIVGEIVVQMVKLVLNGSSSIETDADLVDFYNEFSDLVQTKVTSGTWDGRLIPNLLPWILRDRSDLPDFYSIYLPKLIATSPAEFMGNATKICSSGAGQLISPVQLFVQVHLISTATTTATNSMNSTVSVPLKNLIEVLQLIFGQSQTKDALFSVQVLSTGLGQLVDQTPLPHLLGRSLLQSVPLLNPSSPLNAPFLLSLLARLIPRKIWEAGKLWEGWIRCCRALLPGSLSVLLQLPTAQLEKLLKEGSGGSDLKTPLREYLYNQPPSVRNRYASILSTIENNK